MECDTGVFNVKVVRLVLLVGLLIPTAVGGAQSDSAQLDVVPILSHTPNRAELEDLRDLALIEGLSFAEAKRSYGWEPALVSYVEDLRKSYTDFSGASINGDRSVTIAFKGKVPDQVRHDPSLDGLRARLVANVGASERELWVRQDEVRAKLIGRGVSEFIVSFEFESGRLHVVIGDQTSEGVQVGPLELGTDVDLSVAPGSLSRDQATVYGGARLEKAGSNLLGCTSAFKVKKGSTTGFLIAGHCFYSPDVGFTHENQSGHAEYSAVRHYPVHYNSTYGDFRWYSTSQTESDDFYYKPGFRRDLSSVGGIPVRGQSLWRYGHKTGRQLNSVLYPRIVSGDGLWWVVMSKDTAQGGDSGGPYYWGNKGYGVHKGGIGPISGQSRDYYSRLDLADEALGVTVSTS